MSVQKLNSMSRSHLPSIPFTQICNHVIQNIKNAEAFMVWVYLLSKSENWDVIKSHVKNHFGYGDKKIKNIFSYLNSRGLIKYLQVRSDDGRRISHNDIAVLDGKEYITDQSFAELSTKVSLQGQLSTRNKTNPCRKEGTTKERSLLKKEKTKIKREPARASLAPLPDDFVFDERVEQRADEKAREIGMSLKDLRDKFKAYAKERGLKSADWNASFQKFVIDERSALPGVGIKKVAAAAPSVPIWGPGHPTWDSLNSWDKQYA